MQLYENLQDENYFEGFDISDNPIDVNDGGLSLDDTDDLDQLSKIQIDESIKQILKEGIDIHKYSKEIEKQLREESKKQLCAYEEQEGELMTLHSDIKDCDDVLANMEDKLSEFKLNLGNIHNDIQVLQNSLLNMSISLNNHIITEKQLSRIVDGYIVSPKTVRIICDGQVDNDFLDSISDLNKKIAYTNAHREQKDKIKSFVELEPELDLLRLKASMRIREFFLTKIKSLRALNTNVCIIQNSIFTKYQLLNHFLIEHHPEAAVEIRDNYIHVMRHYYSEHFNTYYEGLKGLEQKIGEKSDMIGHEEQTKISFFGPSKAPIKDKRNIFNIGSRIDVLNEESNDKAVILQLAEESNKKIFFEVLFRSYLLALVDNAATEHKFISQFFTSPKARSKSAGPEMVAMVFDHIFQPAISIGKKFVEQYVETSYDVLGLFLCILVAKSNQASLQHYFMDIASLNSFIDQAVDIILPRLQYVLQLHISSIKKLYTRTKPAKLDSQPHTSVRRYAELTVSLLKLSAGNDIPEIEDLTNELRNQVHEFLQKAAAGHADNYQQSLRSLINNYDLIVNVIQENGFTEQDEDMAFWRQLLADTVYEFAEEQLNTHFKYLKECVTKFEQKSDILDIDPKQMNQVILQFNKDWQKQIASINTEIIQSFSNFRTGTEILHAVLGQLVIYYTRFHNLYDKYIASSSVVATGDGNRDLTAVPIKVKNVMVEAKKYRNNF